jgi:hypothetical protein
MILKPSFIHHTTTNENNNMRTTQIKLLSMKWEGESCPANHSQSSMLAVMRRLIWSNHLEAACTF